MIWGCLLIGLGCQLSPGPLSKPHANLEGLSNCKQCHTVGSDNFAPNCLSCHEALNQRIKAKKGFHATVKKPCQSCHSDHHGEAFALIFWEQGKTEFDHSLAGWDLQGKHKNLSCEDCHQSQWNKNAIPKPKSSTTFLGLKPSCQHCHTDPHEGQFESTCDNCHQPEGWDQLSFDHQKTGFPLTGQHTQSECKSCHQNGKFKGIEFAKCADCHADLHQGQFTKDCEACHTTNGFQPASFNHDQARFRLKASHQDLSCISCHVLKNEVQIFRPIAFQDCDACHKSPHREKWDKCSSCHVESSWKRQKVKFDHSSTRFPLIGMHAQVGCETCHQKGLQVNRFEECIHCHTNPHQNQIMEAENCEKCHSEQGFVPSSFSQIDHQNTAFKLTGSHLATPCGSCHEAVRINGVQTRQFHFTNQSCETCHGSPHQDLEERSCDSCHQTDGWSSSTFNHSQVGFALQGAHQRTACLNCHDIKHFEVADTSCGSCHQDIHQGQFQESCDQCHVGFEQWSQPPFDHKKTEFPLDGAHIKVSCNRCHIQESSDGKAYLRYRPTPKNCQDCHG